MILYYCLRWILFFLVGVPIQAFILPLYAIFSAYFLLFIRGREGSKLSLPASRWTIPELLEKGLADPVRNDFFLDNLDNHNALVHFYFWILRPELAPHGLKKMVYENGSLYRRWPNETSDTPVSGDCLSAWVTAATKFGCDREDLRKVAKHYLKNCLGLGSIFHGWQVSGRSSNSGMNYIFDGWGNFNQPVLAPQYFTSAGLLCLAANRLGGVWHLIYWAHYWKLCGWMWTLIPFIHPKGNQIYYAQHITLINLYSIYKLTGNPLYKWSISFIIKGCAPAGNIHPYFYCLAADVGMLSVEDIDKALKIMTVINHSWPQHSPSSEEYFKVEENSPWFGPAAGVAKMLMEARASQAKQ